MSKARTLTMKRLRRIVKEEANLLQAKTRPEDVSPDEMPWEEAEDVGRQDFQKQMDKPTPAVKAEARLRVLEQHADRLQLRLEATQRRIRAYRRRIAEARRR